MQSYNMVRIGEGDLPGSGRRAPMHALPREQRQSHSRQPLEGEETRFVWMRRCLELTNNNPKLTLIAWCTGAPTPQLCLWQPVQP